MSSSTLTKQTPVRKDYEDFSDEDREARYHADPLTKLLCRAIRYPLKNPDRRVPIIESDSAASLVFRRKNSRREPKKDFFKEADIAEAPLAVKALHMGKITKNLDTKNLPTEDQAEGIVDMMRALSKQR
jgi:hypothetical protein